jgi:hypothetical protein
MIRGKRYKEALGMVVNAVEGMPNVTKTAVKDGVLARMTEIPSGGRDSKKARILDSLVEKVKM